VTHASSSLTLILILLLPSLPSRSRRLLRVILPRPSTCFDRKALLFFTASCRHKFGGTGLSNPLPSHARINTATATSPSPSPPSTRLSQLYLLHLASDKLATHVRARQLLVPYTRAIPSASLVAGPHLNAQRQSQLKVSDQSDALLPQLEVLACSLAQPARALFSLTSH
jgi:hypothetical protein